MTTRLTFDNEWRATVTDDPLRIAPRFTSDSVDVGQYADAKERERFLADTFGSQEWLWDNPDVLRFDPAGRKLVGVELQLPGESASVEDSARVPDTPAVRPGGLRADEVRDFRLEMCAVLCRTPGDTALTGLRDLDVLDEPLEARVGIAPEVALLVQHGTRSPPRSLSSAGARRRVPAFRDTPSLACHSPMSRRMMGATAAGPISCTPATGPAAPRPARRRCALVRPVGTGHDAFPLRSSRCWRRSLISCGSRRGVRRPP
ncbi:hypothetical protein [Streptomyces mirabilis]|uniref:hypothetical protein n=2 Tax=Streptomyces mirabilis TaxID=68239 RepID=UPI0036B9BCF9